MIAIIMVLAGLVFGGVRKAMLKAQKVSCLNTMRSVSTALQAYISDKNVPPIPQEIRDATGKDTVFGVYGSQTTNAYIVAVLEGKDQTFSIEGGTWLTSAVNPNFEEYVILPRSLDKKNGVFEKEGDPLDGQLYDAWGRTLMIALNVPPYSEEQNEGKNDKWLDTGGLATYSDTFPREEAFAIWSYGKDGFKGTAGKAAGSNPFRGSDDVISW